MNVDILVALLAIIVGPVTAVTTWTLTKKKTSADTDSSIANGANLAVETIMSVMQELREQVAALSREADALKVENGQLRQQIQQLRFEISKLRLEA